jgi:hypothetical protein
MPNINVLRESKFLTRADAGKGILVTITNVSQANVAMDGQPVEMQWILHFKETAKPFILKSVNGQNVARILGSEEMNDWAGKQIVLYDDPTVIFAGKQIGGIRIRAPKFKTVEPQAAVPPAMTQGSGHFAQYATPQGVQSQPGLAHPTHPIPLAQDLDNEDDIPF